MRFFKNIETLEELKKEYKRLVLINHPDRGGDEETMKAINAEYDEMFKIVGHVHKNKEGEKYTKETTETPEQFKEIIEKLIRMSGVEIEVIGSFIWLSGNTKEHKEEIKALGFRWHSNKKMWYKSPEGYRKFGKKKYSMDEIRSMYGTSGKFSGENKNAVTVA